MYNKGHKIKLSGPFGDFVFDVILIKHLLLARANNRNVIITLPKDSMRPLTKQIEIFSRILTVYFNCIYGRATRMPPRDSPSGRNPCGDNKQITP